MLPRKMEIQIFLTYIIISINAINTIVMTVAHENDICTFNRLCTCRKSHHEVICRGVPFLIFPTFPSEDVYQVTIVRSGIESLESNILQGSNVASLHLMHNNIVHLSPKAFGGLEDILTTLDLSNNKLQEFPFIGLGDLNNLQWLNLYGNQISSIHSLKWTQLNARTVLHSLFLGSNHITFIPDGAFVRLSNLNLLDMEGNLISDIGIHPFPSALTSLSLSNNILKKVPLHAIYSLRNLKFLYLSGNLIKRLPCPFYLHIKQLEKLELSNNALTELAECVFNGSFVIKELHLEFNFLRALSARSFRGTKMERLFAANNRINLIHSDAFSGVEKTLMTLDLSFNLIEIFPSAINDLKSLIYLSLKSNLLKHISRSDLHGSRSTLEILDLSGNLFSNVPKLGLKHLSKLVRLSLQDNKIHKIHKDDFEGWGKTLTTLSLANNRMTHIAEDAFTHLTRLKELKLSFNNLLHLAENTFLSLKLNLEFLDLTSAFSKLNHSNYAFVVQLENLEWLQLDHNSISEIPVTVSKLLSKIRHLDLNDNEMKEIPANLFSSLNITFLNALHISNNDLRFVKRNTFSNVPRLTTTVFFGNKIQKIESYAFNNCRFLHTVVLSKNNISSIDSAAFANLSRLSNVFLQDNQLELFSFDIIEGETALLYINASNNKIRHLDVNNINTTTKVRTLDLTNNKISVIKDLFFIPTSKYLQHLFLSNNRITKFSFPRLPILQVLDLSRNNLTSLAFDNLRDCDGIQILSLSHNNLNNITEDAFKSLNNLRLLDLSHNKLHVLSKNTLTETKLERLNISGNHFSAAPIATLLEIREHLRNLDLSFNSIGNLSDNMFSRFIKLEALNLSSNQIAYLHEASFYGLNNLLELDISHNPLRFIANENVFSHLNALRFLSLRNASLLSLNALPNPLLNVLILSDNFLFNISEFLFSVALNLRHLDISGNLLQDVPHHAWRNTKFLNLLDISRNPIDYLGSNSFIGLENLQNLDISGLSLKRLDPRTLQGLRYLTTIKTDSYASVRSFRLQDILSQAHAIHKVTINVEESTLSHQVQRAFGTKLRELIITGPNLQRVLPDAFAGLSTHELTIRICGTKVSKFPDGLLKYLPDVRYLTLDLRNNQLMTMTPEVLAAITRDGTEMHQTQHIAGGVLLEENPWNCSCELLWLGRWLRRWLRETFHVHMLSVEAALYVNSVSRNAKCSVPGTNNTISLIDLKRSDLSCGRSVNKASLLVPKCWRVHVTSFFMIVLSIHAIRTSYF